MDLYFGCEVGMKLERCKQGQGSGEQQHEMGYGRIGEIKYTEDLLEFSGAAAASYGTIQYERVECAKTRGRNLLGKF
jgi:hypothetical protein